MNDGYLNRGKEIKVKQVPQISIILIRLITREIKAANTWPSFQLLSRLTMRHICITKGELEQFICRQSVDSKTKKSRQLTLQRELEFKRLTIRDRELFQYLYMQTDGRPVHQYVRDKLRMTRAPHLLLTSCTECLVFSRHLFAIAKKFQTRNLSAEKYSRWFLLVEVSGGFGPFFHREYCSSFLNVRAEMRNKGQANYYLCYCFVYHRSKILTLRY